MTMRSPPDHTAKSLTPDLTRRVQAVAEALPKEPANLVNAIPSISSALREAVREPLEVALQSLLQMNPPQSVAERSRVVCATNAALQAVGLAIWNPRANERCGVSFAKPRDPSGKGTIRLHPRSQSGKHPPQSSIALSKLESLFLVDSVPPGHQRGSPDPKRSR
jgi:hypothetical protein